MRKFMMAFIVLSALVVSSCSTADSLDEIELTDQKSGTEDGNTGSNGSGSDDPFEND